MENQFLRTFNFYIFKKAITALYFQGVHFEYDVFCEPYPHFLIGQNNQDIYFS